MSPPPPAVADGAPLTCVTSPAGYDLSPWRDTLLKLGQTRVFFSTTPAPPYRSACAGWLRVSWETGSFLMLFVP